jgi:hypothetical protein
MIKTFKQYFEDRQMMMFSTKPVELYHGTTTGKDNKTLNNFKNHGIISTASGGYGQGHGFYVFSDIKSARKQAVAIKESASYRMGKDNSGYPMVVAIDSILDPENWDIDYEINKNVVLKFLLNNFDKVKDKLESDHISIKKVTMGLRPWEKPDYYKQKKEKPHPLSANVPPSNDSELTLEPLESWQYNPLLNVGGSRPQGFIISPKKDRPLITHSMPDRPSMPVKHQNVFYYGDKADSGAGGMMDGEAIGTIMNLLQKNDPRVVHSFEELFFSNMGPKVAIKYVGKKPLQPKRIEVFKTEGRPLDNQLDYNPDWVAV